jgi:hypothetical protein
MSLYWRGVFGSYGLRLRALAHEPLRVSLALLHLLTLVGAVVITVTQLSLAPGRTMAAVVLGFVALFALTTPGAGAGVGFIVTTGLMYLLLSTFEGVLHGGLHPPPTWEVLLLAAALFGSHQVDALRGLVPRDSAGDPQVLLRWFLRGAEALAAGLLVGALVLGIPTSERGGVFWLVGGAGVLLAVGIPAFAVNRRPWRTARRR